MRVSPPPFPTPNLLLSEPHWTYRFLSAPVPSARPPAGRHCLGGSQPTLNPATSPGDATPYPEDWLWLSKWAVQAGSLERGDVVTLLSPQDHGTLLVKRIIALGGDIITTPDYKDKSVPPKDHHHYHHHHHISSVCSVTRLLGHCRFTKVPAGSCWVESDNAATGRDSNTYGPVPMGLLQGKAVGVLWPPRRVHAISSTIPQVTRKRYLSLSSKHPTIPPFEPVSD